MSLVTLFRRGVMTVSGRSALLVTLSFISAAVAACQSDKAARVDFSDTPRNYVAADYNDIYERWTRHEFALRDVEKALEVWVTYKSWDFREAFIERYATTYSLSDADRAKLRAGQMNAFHEAYEFHMVAQSANYKWNDLEKSSSPWVVTLLDALGHELPREAVTVRIEKVPDAFEREFFPAKTPFSTTYSVRFVVPANSDFAGIKSGAITLRIAGPLGRVELTWRS
ncbi:MAG TPA: hypothetical protein VN903_05375 [Polyangia bacterium]|jgi:hypothetical protein|nr:hypothetical protein [Polyangia bacterium]